MIYPKVRLVYDRHGKTKTGKPGTVEIEIYWNGRRKMISTGVAVESRFWNPVRLVEGHPDSFYLTRKIEAEKKRITDWLTSLAVESKPFSFEALASFLSPAGKSQSFTEWMSGQIDDRRDMAANTRKNHEKAARVVAEFGRLSLFSNLTRTNIEAFDTWLHDKGLCQSTVHFYHKTLKVYVRRAVLAGLLKTNPYDGVAIKRGKHAERRYLTDAQLEDVRRAPLSEPLRKVRDMFLFQACTGLAYVDMQEFDPSKVSQRPGRCIYHGRRHKSSEDFYIVLNAEALAILERHGGKLPQMSNAQYNMRLKIIAEAAGVPVRVTSHTARHTFAVRALNSGVPIEVVAKILGHTDIATTQIYAKIVNKTVEKAFDLLDG